MLNDVAYEAIGAKIARNAPLMSAGLDSISATEFTGELATRFSVDLAPTVLFDHPTLESLASFLSDKLASNGVAEALPHVGEQPVAAQVPILNTREEQKITITAWNFSIAGGRSRMRRGRIWLRWNGRRRRAAKPIWFPRRRPSSARKPSN